MCDLKMVVVACKGGVVCHDNLQSKDEQTKQRWFAWATIFSLVIAGTFNFQDIANEILRLRVAIS